MEINVIKRFLKSKDWQFTEVKGKNIFVFGISGKNGSFQCVAESEAESKFTFFSICGANTPPNRKEVMCELLNSLNYELFTGNFEMDLDSGEIRFRNSIAFRNIEVSQELIEDMIMTTIVTMDNHLPAIMGFMFGGIGVKEALELSKTFINK